MQRKTTGTAATLIIGCCLFVTAGAATKPEDVIKYRHAVMGAMSGHIGAFKLIAVDGAGAGKYLQNHADAVTNLSRELEGLFPEGSGAGDTDALPAIWDDSEKFAAAIAKLQETSSALQRATRSGDNKTIMGAFAETGKACKGCHEKFRAEDDDNDSDDHNHDDHDH